MKSYTATQCADHLGTSEDEYVLGLLSQSVTN